MGNIVIGIEGYVGTGKTSVCRKLLDKIPNSVLLHGGNIYRAITYGILKTCLINVKEDNNKLSSLNIKNIMDKLKLRIEIEDRESVVYIHDKKIDEKDLQSLETSIATSKISSYANNDKLYDFGRNIIENLKQKYNVILSSRDIVNMYPGVTKHFFIDASKEERTNRKYMQYNKEIPKEQVQEMIKLRDELQEKSGYYAIYPQTKILDVTNCKSAKEAEELVLESMKREVIKSGV